MRFVRFRVVRLNPAFAEAYNVLGRAYVAKGRVDEAIACYQKALEVRPDYVVAHNSLGNLLLHNGQVDQAMIHCRKALELDPDNETVMNNLGNALASQGHFDEATVWFPKGSANQSRQCGNARQSRFRFVLARAS